MNCNDDKGVLLGKWTDGYEGGVSPLVWRGSVEILRNWDTQSCQPVRYGQCWVFAAVACSGKKRWAIGLFRENDSLFLSIKNSKLYHPLF